MYLSASKRFFHRVALALFLSLLTNSVSAADSNSGTDHSDVPKPLRFSSLLRMTVESRDGHELGKVRNVLIDATHGRAQFFLLAPDGIIASRNRLRAAPPELLSAATAKRNVIAFHVSERDWEEAPAFKNSEITSLGTPDRVLEIQRHYSRINKNTDRVTAESAQLLSATGPKKISGTTVTRPVLATDLVGSAVVDEQQKKVGEVLDVLLALEENSPVFLIVSVLRSDTREGSTYAVPLRRVQMKPDGDLVVTWDASSLTNAHQFTGAVMTNLNVSSYYRYRGEP